MIKFEHTEVVGWEHAIRGMRNPLNSWDKSDTTCGLGEDYYTDMEIGPNDLDLMTRLRNAGTDHRKFMRMLTVYVDITAPLYWWKEFDTYKVGTVANSCSTMHKIHAKKFTLDDFSHEHLFDSSLCGLEEIIQRMNFWRSCFIEQSNPETRREDCVSAKECWWQMIQLLPTSYNQKRTVMLNYEVLANIYKPTSRLHHKLDEWDVDCDGSFCKWIETLPYAKELIVGNTVKE